MSNDNLQAAFKSLNTWLDTHPTYAVSIETVNIETGRIFDVVLWGMDNDPVYNERAETLPLAISRVLLTEAKSKWFAAAILAIKETDDFTLYENRPAIFQAATKEGAQEYFLQKAKTEWYPESEGWTNHKVDVIEFPEEAK